MSIEKLVEDLTAAVNAQTAAIQENTKAVSTLLAGLAGLSAGAGAAATDTKAPPAGKGKEEKKEPPKPKHSIDDVRNALREYSKLEGKEAAKEKLKEVGGVDAVGDLPEEKYEDVINALNA